MPKMMYVKNPPRFSRQWWLGGIRSLFWVGVVSVLIFAYADLEFTDEKEFHATIVLTTSADQGRVILSQRRHEVTFRLTGGASALLRFEEALNAAGATLEVDLSQTVPPGNHEMPTRQLVNLAAGRAMDRESLDEAGISVSWVSQEVIDVQVDRRITREVDVEFRYTGAELAGLANIDPPRVDVRVAESHWKQLTETLGPDETPRIETRPVDLRNVAGESLTVELVPSIGGLPVDPNAPTVDVAYTIRTRARTKDVKITVRLLTPHTWAQNDTWQEFRLEAKDDFWWQKDIVLSGSQEDLERLSPRDIDAYVVLNESHKVPVETYYLLPVHIRLPADMDVRLVGTAPSVQIRLARRTGDGT